MVEKKIINKLTYMLFHVFSQFYKLIRGCQYGNTCLFS